MPKEEKVAKKWKINVNRVGPQPKDENYFLCETHFEESCFELDLKAELTGYKSSGKKLKVGSICKSICEKKNADELPSCSRDVFEEGFISEFEYSVSDHESQDDFDPLDVSVDEVEKKIDIDYNANHITRHTVWIFHYIFRLDILKCMI